MKRWIMHVDMDAFFASVEQLDHPEYRGKPLVVGGQSMRGVVATASYEARRFGVHSAMPMVEAKRRCPQGIFVTGNYKRYQEVSQEIFKVFHDFSPCVEPLSIDEAFLDITGMERLFKDPCSYAIELKAQIFKETGLVASVGLAPNKFLAKLASDLKKPDGLVQIEYGHEKEVLKELPIRRLWGVGKKAADKLAAIGIRTIGQIAVMEHNELEKCFGAKTAAHLIALANGKDDRPVECENSRQSIGNEITFEKDIFQRNEIFAKFLALAEKVGFRLRREGVKARTITVKIRTASFHTITRSKTLSEDTDFDKILYETAVELYTQSAPVGGIRLLGITANKLSFAQQESLFVFDEKQKKLYQTMDALKNRFGETIITKAQLIRRKEENE